VAGATDGEGKKAIGGRRGVGFSGGRCHGGGEVRGWKGSRT
jgi:hypothetical protein